MKSKFLCDEEVENVSEVQEAVKEMMPEEGVVAQIVKISADGNVTEHKYGNNKPCNMLSQMKISLSPQLKKYALYCYPKRPFLCVHIFETARLRKILWSKSWAVRFQSLACMQVKVLLFFGYRILLTNPSIL